ncbi:hypothetical protein PAGU2196_52470 [Pseudomonas sp. PAGU 2196]|nr:hypothetical protein PAGU2196_52470 [Pseudomonas sp. PAGU 2196]
MRTALDPGLKKIVATFDGNQVEFVDMADPGLGIELMQVHESTSQREPRECSFFVQGLRIHKVKLTPLVSFTLKPRGLSAW